jgi:hypothetical protein
MANIRQSINATPVQIATWFRYTENIETLTEPQKAVILRSLGVKAKINKHQNKYVVVWQYPTHSLSHQLNTLYSIVRKYKKIHYLDLKEEFYKNIISPSKQAYHDAIYKLKYLNLIRCEPCTI